MKLWLSVLAGLTLVPSAGLGQPLACVWSSKVRCDPNGTCHRAPISVSTTADPEAKRYERCDHKACDSYTAVISTSEAFTTYDLVGHGTFLKIGPGGLATEVTSVGNSVLVSHGSCQPKPVK